MRALTLGDEAIIDTEGFRLSGRAMRPVRQAVNRVERAGYTAELRRHAELSEAELAEVAHLAEAWRGNETERGFSMALGRLGDPADGRCVVVIARDPSGSIRGLLSFVPWGRRGLSLDLMRRSPEAENGVTEFMVASLIRNGEQMGIRRISLNFAVFRRIFSSAEEVGAGPVTRVSDAVLRFASRYYQLDTLYHSNAKYGPTWVPRMLCYDPTLTAPRAALAMAVAEGFLPSVTVPLLSGAHPEKLESPRDPGFAERVRELEQRLSQPAAPVVRLNDQQRVRLDKARAMTDADRAAYPPRVPRDHSVAEALETLAGHLADDSRPRELRVGTRMQITGRVRALATSVA